MPSQTFDTIGTFPIPTGVTSLNIVGWGAGGDGAPGSIMDPDGGAGGGSGARAEVTSLSVSDTDPDLSIDIQNPPATTTVTTGGGSPVTVLLATDGTDASGTTPGTGGAASGCIGDIKTSGANGNAPSGTDGGAGGSAPSGGAGGAGGTSASPNGGDGVRPGGGGGGGSSVGSGTGGTKALGRVIITWTEPATTNPGLLLLLLTNQI